MSDINADSLGLSVAPTFLGVFGGIGGLVTGNSSSAAITPTPSQPFSNIYAFGDSLSDDGNDYIGSLNVLPVSPPYNHLFSNGAVWVQDLAAVLGVPQPTASLSGGTDFAYGGAETGKDPLHSENPLDLPSQLQQFQFAVPHPNPNALYTLSAGSNDVLDAISTWFTNPTEAFQDLQVAVNNITSFVFGLAGDGARDVLLLNVPDLGKAPAETSGGPFQSFVASALSSLFDADLGQTMQVLAAQAHINVGVVDTYSLIDNAVANPSVFGVSNVTTPVWTGNYTDPNSGTLASSDPAVQNQYLFWDHMHPTAQAHAVVAAAAHNALFGGVTS